MLAAGLCFVSVNGAVRHLGPVLPAAQAAFLRFAIGMIFVAPALVGLLRQGFPAPVWRLIGLRGLFHTAGVCFWFYAMARLPVAEVTAIGFLNPVGVTLGAVLVFGERLRARRLAAIGLALIGALVILRPGLRDITPAHLSQLMAALCFAGSYLLAKGLAARMSAGAVVAMMSASVTLGLAPLAALRWQPPALDHLAWLGLAAAGATAAHYCMTRAFALAPMALTQPVTFLQLLWAAALGALAFGEPIDPYVILGGAIIIAAISYITWREQRLRGQEG